MNALEVSQRSTDAWNRHDADALIAVYAEGGTYHNPRLDHALTGPLATLPNRCGQLTPTCRSRSLVEGTLEGAWSPFSGCYTEPTPVRLWTAPRLPVAPSPIRGLPSLRLTAIRFARSTHTLTGRRWLSNSGSKPSKPEAQSTGSLRPPNGNPTKGNRRK